MHHAPFRSPQSKDAFLGWYARQLAAFPHEEREVDTAEGGRTHLVIAGSGPPLFLIHGAGAGAAHLRDEILFFAKSHRVIAPEIPGHMGKSEARKLSYRDAALGRWLDQVFTALKISSANVIG